jgi:hypothetical protein
MPACLDPGQCLNCGGGGLRVEPPSCFPNPPKHDALGYPGGSVSTPPPPLLMMLNRLCVMAMTMNRQMSTPTYFLTIQILTPAAWFSEYYVMPATKKCCDKALLFWKDDSSRNKLPLLSQLAEIYLGISPSSVPVECLLPQPDLY